MKFNSTKYWNDRYKNGGDSGAGSKNKLATYKADIVNKFALEHDVSSVCELGCGDGLFNLFCFSNYTGYDVSEFIINRNTANYPQYRFTSDINKLTRYDLTLSMDVILHLIDDSVYMKYMHDLFILSKKYVIIYDVNRDEKLRCTHNNYRLFLHDVPKEFKLIKHINNPHKGTHTQADFFIFKRLYG